MLLLGSLVRTLTYLLTARIDGTNDMDVEIRATSSEEFPAFARGVGRAFSEHPAQEEIDAWQMVHEPKRSLAAFEGAEIVGTAGAFTMTLSIPGGALPMAGVTAVGVASTHRRRGILTAMMRRQLGDVRDLGEPLAGLWASEGPIYQRFGYGLASFACSIKIERSRTQFYWPIDGVGRLRLVEKEDALKVLPAVYERVQLGQPGMLGRDQTWWEHLLIDLKDWRDGASALFFAVHETKEGPDGYVQYRVKHPPWSEAGAVTVLRVRELVAATPQAYAALWRYCFDVDLIGRIEAWPRPVDEPLIYMLADPRWLNFEIGDGLWLRLVDVPGSLAARRYAQDGSVVFEVQDAFCPWNEGRYLLEGGPEGAECSPTDREPDLVVHAADLGAAYLGGGSFSTLARAGRVVEATPGSLARADRMFIWGPKPWCPQVF
jgi:predicted acetyltransferase